MCFFCKKLDTIIELLRQIQQQTQKEFKKMSAEMDALVAEVATVTQVEQSAVTLIQGLAAQLAAAGTDPAKLAALTNDLNASASALAAAVAANTPAPAPTPTPAP